jgi:hypothetical protein
MWGWLRSKKARLAEAEAEAAAEAANAPAGWIVGVDHEDGALLFAVALESSLEAVDLVQAELGITEWGRVWPQSRATLGTLAGFKLGPGEIRGPF